MNGKIKESKNDLENLKYFIKRWIEKIKEIKNVNLDNKQAYNLVMDYLNEWDKFMYNEELKNSHTILTQLTHDLYFAICQANNNYRKKFPSFWDRFHKLKLPDINLIKTLKLQPHFQISKNIS